MEIISPLLEITEGHYIIKKFIISVYYRWAVLLNTAYPSDLFA
jgi:hypothetical protein